MEIYYRFNDANRVVGCSVYHPVWGVIHFNREAEVWIADDPYGTGPDGLYYKCLLAALEALEALTEIHKDCE